MSKIFDSTINVVRDMTAEEQTQYDLDNASAISTVDADEELAKNIAAATTIAGLKDALLGKYGIARVKGEKK